MVAQGTGHERLGTRSVSASVGMRWERGKGIGGYLNVELVEHELVPEVLPDGALEDELEQAALNGLRRRPERARHPRAGAEAGRVGGAASRGVLRDSCAPITAERRVRARP